MPPLRRASFLTLASLSALIACGCGAPAQQHRHELDQFGQVFYADGAGGGGLTGGWGGGVREGLREAGFKGDFYNFPWQTGFGFVPDHSSSVEYKRGKAKRLADEIRTYRSSHPESSADLVALSAGTAVAVFALEALPPDAGVDNLVLLGSSLSQHYDLTSALSRVRNHAYVFTSEHDTVLSILATIGGAADRQTCAACSAGLRGFHLPPNSTDRTRRAYYKMINIDWRPEFKASGHAGGHTDSVNAGFIRAHVAPLLIQDGPVFVQARS